MRAHPAVVVGCNMEIKLLEEGRRQRVAPAGSEQERRRREQPAAQFTGEQEESPAPAPDEGNPQSLRVAQAYRQTQAESADFLQQDVVTFSPAGLVSSETLHSRRESLRFSLVSSLANGLRARGIQGLCSTEPTPGPENHSAAPVSAD